MKEAKKTLFRSNEFILVLFVLFYFIFLNPKLMEIKAIIIYMNGPSTLQLNDKEKNNATVTPTTCGTAVGLLSIFPVQCANAPKII